MKALMLYMAIFLSFAAHANKLPDCPVDQSVLWDNCTGTFTYMSGDKYVGEFRDDKMDGPGTFTWANGNRHTCIYKNGMQQGNGTSFGLMALDIQVSTGMASRIGGAYTI
jgi:hypothetical protein